MRAPGARSSHWCEECGTIGLALALCGELGRARETFEGAAGFANDLGLLAEEVDTNTGALLGNFPQAFSHVGLVNAAWAITEAERQRES